MLYKKRASTVKLMLRDASCQINATKDTKWLLGSRTRSPPWLWRQ